MNQTKLICKSYATSQALVCLLEDFFFKKNLISYSSGNKQTNKKCLFLSLSTPPLFSQTLLMSTLLLSILVLPPESSLRISNYMHQDCFFILLWFLRVSVCQWFPNLTRLTWASFLSFKTILLPILNTWTLGCPWTSQIQLRWNLRPLCSSQYSNLLTPFPLSFLCVPQHSNTNCWKR